MPKEEFDLEKALEKIESLHGESSTAYIIDKKGYLKRVSRSRGIDAYRNDENVEFWWTEFRMNDYIILGADGQISWFGESNSHKTRNMYEKMTESELKEIVRYG